MDRKTADRIGYLPEERGLYRKMKVIDHLYFLAAIKEVSRDTARKRIDGWLDKMELRPWLNKKVDELSKGMQQKVQFIATIVHDPDILILDEPFSGLDPINVALMRDYFVDFRAARQDDRLLHARARAGREALRRDHADGALEEDPRGLAEGAQAPQLGGPAPHEREGDGRRDRRRSPESHRPRRSTASTSSSSRRASDQRDFLKRALDRYEVDAFSQKEPDLEEIYIDAVRNAGIEETRTIE